MKWVKVVSECIRLNIITKININIIRLDSINQKRISLKLTKNSLWK